MVYWLQTMVSKGGNLVAVEGGGEEEAWSLTEKVMLDGKAMVV